MNTRWQQIVSEVLSLPTAPFAEQAVVQYVLDFASARRPLRLTRDRAGNLLIRFRRGDHRPARPVCITAHMDHPGFICDRMTGRSACRAFWRGGVPPELFVGSGVRFHTGGRWVRGVVRSVRIGKTAMGRELVKTATIEVRGPVDAGSPGMWDLPAPRERGGRLYARACDDTAGVAAILCCLDDLCRSRSTGEAYFLLTRAEEVGFIGAIAACRNRTIPRKCFVVNVETSSELPGARMGDGPILRVGDKASVFTPRATAFVHDVAKRLAAGKDGFRFQRKLMDGGTCEASAFAHLGYDATGLCLALGNYHNVDRKRNRIGPEYIHLDDFTGLVRWFIALVRQRDTTSSRGAGAARSAGLDKTLKNLESQYARLLADTAGELAAETR